MRNALDNDKLVYLIDDLALKRKDWEHGVYKTSTEQLCQLLEDCLALYMQVRAEPKLVRRISALMSERKLVNKSNTSLETRLVRLVFGECGKRVYAYARVLSIAATEKPEGQSMLTYVSNKGGIENLRRRPSGDKVDVVSNEVLADRANVRLAETTPIVADIAATPDMVPEAGSKYQYSVALIATDGTGRASIVYATKDQTLVRNALVRAGKKLKIDATASSALDERRVDAAKREQLLSQLAA